MKKKTKIKKPKSVPVYKGSKVLGRVGIEYVQVDVPAAQIDATAEALSHVILTEFYSKYLQFRVTDTE